ncbi:MULTISPECIES: heme exporter protein CcmD [Pseudovibrio]|uniref:heme exporter protein CcmD n=1 Tax=Stappiaceae TaxID=2821832 RepID=UPI0023651C92|nr:MULTISPECIES: heme exporter protein CcmD [Pseudovibrio]MDD7909447.1 heme exporter protein CcmD [Pseudovibrio exalbescens]MDX5595006.1 heme exporter protein CcmD [Pseudovibrio sp. SPO723]
MESFLPDLGRHAGFVIAAYVVATLVIGGIVLFVRADQKKQEKDLQELEAMGLRRRSQKKG